MIVQLVVMNGINVLRQHFIRSPLSARQASTLTQGDIKAAFSYCSEQVRCERTCTSTDAVCSTSACNVVPCAGNTIMTTTYGCCNFLRYLFVLQPVARVELSSLPEKAVRPAGAQSSPYCPQMFQCRNRPGGRNSERDRPLANTHAVVARRCQQHISG